MISVRQVDLRRYSYRECWQLAPGLLGRMAIFLSKLFHRPLIVEGVIPCREEVAPAEERFLPAKFKKQCREVAQECRPTHLEFLFYYAYPVFLNGMDLGATFWTADRRTASFLHYCECRWPDTWFYCVSRLEGGRFLLTSDMKETGKFPPELETEFLPHYRYYAEDVLELHASRVSGTKVTRLEESEVGPLIAEVHNRYAHSYRK
jgi:hypothetical protein